MKPVPDLVSLDAEAELAGGDGLPGPRRLALLSCGHFIIDLYSSALGALQPLLVARFGLSLLDVGVLGGLLSFSSSVMQPLYGYLSDRVRSRWFTVLAPFIAGLFISSLGLARGYAGLLALVLLGGVGIAAFHPQGAAHASTTLRERRGLAMAIFISSGSIGLSCGPMLFALVTGTLGLARSYWAALPGLACTLLLAAVLPQPPRHERGQAKHFDLAPFQAVWRPMTLLYFLVIIRSVIQIAFTQFLALYFHSERGFSVSRASLMLTLFLFGGSMGGFLGGNLADRLGGKRIVMFSMIGSAPLLALFMATGGAVSLAALFLGGLILLFTTPVNVTMAQDLVPSQAGTVSALMMGFAWGMAGLVIIPLFGWAADHVGLAAAMRAIVLLPLAGFVLAVLLPEDRPALERAAAR